MISKNLEDTKKIAADFMTHGLKANEKEATVVALSGDLGSGKTTFTQAIAEILGVKEQLVSPTFVIEKIYKIQDKKYLQNFTHLIHIDAYRIEDENELGAIGFKDIIKDSRNLIFIEWPERLQKNIPKDSMEISFKHVDENAREIVFI